MVSGVLLTLLLTAGSARAATKTPSLASCSWNSPGANAYVGELGAAIDRYTDIPLVVRTRLKARMAQRQYDDMAVITRDRVVGEWRYAPALRDMHFGEGRVCRRVTRNRWSSKTEERGLVYCEGKHCVIVPTVCRNVSRVTRLGPTPQSAATAAREGSAASPAALGRAHGSDPSGPQALLPGKNELLFEAPGAGPGLADAGPLGAGGAAALALAAPFNEPAAGLQLLGLLNDAAVTPVAPAPNGGSLSSSPNNVVADSFAAQASSGGGGGSGGSPTGNSGAGAFVPGPLAPWQSSPGSTRLPDANTSVLPNGGDLVFAPVPEPGSGWLMAVGLLAGIGGHLHKRRSPRPTPRRTQPAN